MKDKRSNEKLKNNIIFSSIYQILVLIVPILTTPYVTRIFSISQMGDYGLSLTTASLFVIVSQFGIETYGSREIARAETVSDRNKIFFELLSIQFLVSILMFLLYNFIFSLILPMGNPELYFIQSLLIFVNIFDIAWYFTGIEEIKKTIFRNALTKIFTTFSIFIFIKNDQQLSLYALLNVLGMLIGNLTMVFSSRYYIDYNKRRFSISKKHFSGSCKLLLPRLLNSSSQTVENSVLKFAATSSNVGIYTQSIKINNLLFSIINSAINALSPRMSFYVAQKKHEKVESVFNKGLRYSSIFSVAFISGIFAVSKDFVDFFFGSGYEAIAPVLQVVSLSLILIPIMALLNRGILIPYSKDKEYTISVIIILISTVIFNLLLDPIFGALGAAMAYNISQLLSFIYIIFIIRHILKPSTIFYYIILSIICILGNVYIVNNISNVIAIDNSILSFLFFGIVSISINGILFWIINVIKKKSKPEK